jgi:two-component system CheB/CheR fusion protein
MTRGNKEANKARTATRRGQRKKASKTTHGETGDKIVPVVAIGASAGGLESLRQFFTTMPIDSGMGFVIVQHLQHGRKSMMAEVLASYTQMPVAAASEGARVEPDHVYVIPADCLLTIRDGILHLESWKGELPRRMPIDTLFCALAEDQGRNAVAIVMSGAGSDGTIGVRAIKECGGLAMAEALPGARGGGAFESMPKSAVATGLVDFVVPAHEMPRHLVDYVQHLHEVTERKGVETVEHEASVHLKDICAILLARKGRDFRHYKSSTLLRRIQRRMQVLRIGSAAEYVKRLRSDSEELSRLSREMLITVTSFFRDPDAFEALKTEVLRALVRNKGSDETIRIWIPGCGTGEEAYSIGILLHEVRAELENFVPVQIFATDIDEVAIDTARTGRYPKSVGEDITPARLRRCFIEEEEHYRVNKEIREFCIFSEHDLIQDPPFSRLDLISCRNLLIYLDSELQQRLVPIFHYALREGGCLFLGASGNIAQQKNLFSTIDKKHRIFRRREIVVRPQLEFPVPATAQRPEVGGVQAGRERPQEAAARLVERTVLDRYGPSYVVVDELFKIVQFSRATGRYLEQPAGTPRTNVLEMARPGLRAALRSALHKVAQSRVEVVQPNLPVNTNGATETVDLVVSPVAEKNEGLLYLVVFRPSQQSAAATGKEPEAVPAKGEDASEARVDALERELASTREDLQATIEELETSNEELQSANEELLSMNEELQSSNEELETSKEEIQSVNEELETVNQELSHKISEVDQANTDLKNLLHSTDVATIFLDRKSCIEWYAPAAKRIFNLIESDIGRPITDITAKFQYNDLEADLRKTLRTKKPHEYEVTLPSEQKVFVMRILPYWDAEERVDGLVMTFQDITELKAAERTSQEKAREAEEALAELRSLLDVVPVGVAIARDPEGNDVDINPYGAELLGLNGSEMVVGGVRQTTHRLFHEGEELPVSQSPLLKVLETRKRISDFEARIRREDGTDTEVVITAAPTLDSSGKVLGGITVFADVGQVKEAERQQRILISALQHRVRNILFIVRLLLRETRETSSSLEEFGERFEGRLDALAAAEIIVARKGQGSVDLYELVHEALPQPIQRGADIHIHGPAVRLQPYAAQMMALALNELAVNAVKFGALSASGGKVDVAWDRETSDGSDVLRFHWQESDVEPAPQAPARRGFGHDLIDRRLPRELGGTANIEFGTRGLNCSITLPIAEHVAFVGEEPPEGEPAGRQLS